jgi:hypothetical protein
VAAPELELWDHPCGCQRHDVGDVGSHGGRPVGVPDAVLALVVGAAVGEGPELPTGGGIAGEGGGCGGFGRVVQGVRLRVAWRHRTGSALQPREDASRVKHHRLNTAAAATTVDSRCWINAELRILLPLVGSDGRWC